MFLLFTYELRTGEGHVCCVLYLAMFHQTRTMFTQFVLVVLVGILQRLLFWVVLLRQLR